ncbi:hypothetical protein GH714_023735 [Hevea brasiliensis]|uniref:Trichome birefringence-like C-terminal domain-containing protein n=1 Tax=Hevea brasiliensis TaxID=3981 RepID=A0A6A6KCV3_HEVBR|nr:hypothetical protein GH714_023735 [Hevea brasiliensis]
MDPKKLALPDQGRVVAPLLQGFNTVSVNSSFVSWRFSFPTTHLPSSVTSNDTGAKETYSSEDLIAKAPDADASQVQVLVKKFHLGNSTENVKNRSMTVDEGTVLEQTQEAKGGNISDPSGNGSVLDGTHLGNFSDTVKNVNLPGEEGILIRNFSLTGDGCKDANISTVGKSLTNSSTENNTVVKYSDKGNLLHKEVGIYPGGEEENQNASFETCNIFDGRWVKDDSKPYYPAGSCPHMIGILIVILMGGPMMDLLNGNGSQMSVTSQGHILLSLQDYNCTVDFVGSPFLVRESSFNNKNGTFETLRLDLMDHATKMYQDADIIVFNTGHWWTHEKTSRGEDYYQEGNYVHPRLKVLEAYRRALLTWARWVDKNIDSNQTLVFFRGYSVTHFRGGQWNSGGQCLKETEPIFNAVYLAKYPSKMRAFEHVLLDMKSPVIYLNISRLTDYRKDGHPSIYRMQYKTAEEQIAAERSQDCSHWCLPGVPDTWNELLYASLLKAGRGSWRI